MGKDPWQLESRIQRPMEYLRQEGFVPSTHMLVYDTDFIVHMHTNVYSFKGK